MLFELAQDFHDAVTAMPREHSKHRMLELLEEAIGRDIHFIDRHPTTLFQRDHSDGTNEVVGTLHRITRRGRTPISRSAVRIRRLNDRSLAANRERASFVLSSFVRFSVCMVSSSQEKDATPTHFFHSRAGLKKCECALSYGVGAAVAEATWRNWRLQNSERWHGIAREQKRAFLMPNMYDRKRPKHRYRAHDRNEPPMSRHNMGA
ncbi:MAG: hypothetical protein JW741_19360 [Sedimentisphaerales bacterium]|nr:hypothetical protein [Sedimentisphaerales bacterium]